MPLDVNASPGLLLDCSIAHTVHHDFTLYLNISGFVLDFIAGLFIPHSRRSETGAV